ncbi:hypothetical protein niasHT_000502 [Heterodera trifolii]|uniref:Hexosyltransferase n=1 Tax=Heterodera trifolii TaxID=157864 RepID=A0ABD2LU23_9BILA
MVALCGNNGTVPVPNGCLRWTTTRWSICAGWTIGLNINSGTLPPKIRFYLSALEDVVILYGTQLTNNVWRFLIADPSPQGEADNVQQQLNEEQNKHGDLLLLHGFVDQYLNLHFKLYGGFGWQQRHCADAKWLIKVDDDTVIHLPRMAHWIENKFRHIATKHPLLFVGVGGPRLPLRDSKGPFRKWPKGRVQISAARFSRGKISAARFGVAVCYYWYVSREMYPGEMYPPFVIGGGYMATTETVKAILAQTHKINVLYLEDVMYTAGMEFRGQKISEANEHMKGYRMIPSMLGFG